ncbi:hypothetical protein A3K73_03875 [Candidatus Pacearchaeota archaeon RBG_13_36_9]|nr:MAG: hypothetical protein A3K73_03875 [Candidatus Pacearchaeota archaeon RBG_13_36_9]HJX50527.1 hypothetical protein [Candidatus Nanoarchaeia archaeon]
MDNKPKEQIAIAMFTGAIISLFLLIENLVENFYIKMLVLLLLMGVIIISLKVILDPSTDLHFIGNMIKKILMIRK